MHLLILIFILPLYIIADPITKDFNLSKFIKHNDTSEVSNQVIREVAYLFRIHPDGFYSQNPMPYPTVYDGTYEATYYEYTSRIPEKRGSGFKGGKVCTNDINKAILWSQISKFYGGGDVLDTSETEKYFELRIRWRPNPESITRYRVHKCSYVDFSNYDGDKFLYRHGTNTLSNDTMGIFIFKPSNLESVKELIEYLWYINNWNLEGRKVVKSSIRDIGKFFQYTIYETSITFGDWGMHDVIYLNRKDIFINKKNGLMIGYKYFIKELYGNYLENPIINEMPIDKY